MKSILINNNNNLYATLTSFKNKIQYLDKDGFVFTQGDTLIINYTTERFLDKVYFLDLLKPYLTHQRDHFILIKVQYDNNLFKIAGKQITFTYNQDKPYELDYLYDTLNIRVLALLEEYKISLTTLIHIKIIINKFDKFLLTDIKLDDNNAKYLFNETALDVRKSLAIAPFETDDKDLGNKITGYSLEPTYLSVNFNFNTQKFTDIQLKFTEELFQHLSPHNFNIFIRDVINPPHILVIINDIHETFKITFDFLGNLIS